MKKQSSLSILLLLSLLVAPLAGQTPAPRSTQDASSTNDIVRVTSNLVQVDVTVTDKDGKPVADLRPEDFEIYEDGRRQKITNFSFVSTAPDSPAGLATSTGTEARTQSSDKKERTHAPPSTPATVQRGQVRRTVALVVDDLGLSLESMATVRKALKKFVDEQVRPGDLVAILRTRGGTGALEQFTTDKRRLHAAIERVQWFPVGRADDIGAAGTLSSEAADTLGQRALKELLEFRRESLGVGTLNAVNFAVRGMKELPGRKSVVLFSESFVLTTSVSNSSVNSYNDLSGRMGFAMQRLVEQANRASTVIYTINPSGLQTLGQTAADGRPVLVPDLVLQTTGGADKLGGNTGAGDASRSRAIRPGQGTTEAGIQNLQAAIDARRDTYYESQEVLDFLARETGGLSVRNANDLNEGLTRVLEDQRSFYLIGYRPDEKTFDIKTGRPDFNKITVKVKRAGLRTRTRNGFFGVADDIAARSASARTAPAPLKDALLSPFASGDVDVRLTSLFGNDPETGSFLRSVLHIDARDLSFKEEPDGTRKANVEILAMTFDALGHVIDRIGGTKSISVRGDTFQSLLQGGIVNVLNVPVKPGAYQLRVAVRDGATQKTGSASQFVEVPDFGNGRFALSGIMMSGSRQSELTSLPASARLSFEAGKESDPQTGPAVRRLRQGMVLEYAYLIYNAQSGGAVTQPQLRTKLRLFRDGRLVFSGDEKSFDARGQADPRRLVAQGRFQIGRDLSPGQYILQVVVNDLLAKDRQSAATQWIDFEIVR
jgi:VWFA-related protein